MNCIWIKSSKNIILLFGLILLIIGCEAGAQKQKRQKEPVQVDESLKTRDKLIKTEDDWKKILTPLQFEIMRKAGTERAFSGKYDKFYERGLYFCAACGNALFTSDKKFDSGTGWPSFTAPVFEQNVKIKTDRSAGMVRNEVLCARCGSHLGHVFNDGPKPTGLRYCMNSAALRFEKRQQ